MWCQWGCCFEFDKIFADNFFTGIPLVQTLLEDGFFYGGTVRQPRMKNCQLKSEKDLIKEGRGSNDFKVMSDASIIIVQWFDKKPGNLISSFIGIEPVDSMKRYDAKQHKYSDVPRPYIVKQYTVQLLYGWN